MSTKICVIEDEEDIAHLITYNLEKEGYSVVHHATGDGAFDLIKSESPDLVLLDIMIPGQDGFEICKQLKGSHETANTPIIMVSAKADDANIVTGLELGADDYITKPFGISVLVARVRTALRRKPSGVLADDPVIEHGPMKIYPERYEVIVDGEDVSLTLTEFNILNCLLQRPGRVYSRTQIIDFMRGEDCFVTLRLVDVLLVSLRKKLGPAASMIQTVRGVGYKFKPES